MSQPFFSKHLRIKVIRTPILSELLSYSRKSNKPNQSHVDDLVSVWRGFPGRVQCSYKHIPEISLDFEGYMNRTQSNSGSPLTPSPKKSSKVLRNHSNLLQKHKSLSSGRSKYKKNTNGDPLTPNTKTIAINLNKHKLEEVQLRPQLFQELPFDSNSNHKLECDCSIHEVRYHRHSNFAISDYKLFISCRFAANDFPQLLKKRIFAILSIGESAKSYPSIKGGYFNIQPESGSFTKPLQIATRFLNAKLKLGNVLVHCDTGNGYAGLLIVAYLLKEAKLTYSCAFGLVKDVRPNFTLSAKDETYLKFYEPKKTILTQN